MLREGPAGVALVGGVAAVAADVPDSPPPAH
jgi:hypothetical protein